MVSGVFFDKDRQYEVVVGDTVSFTCSFLNLQDVDQLNITRGSDAEDVITLHRDGTVDQALDNFVVASADWGTESGSVTIDATIQCVDEDLYRCEAIGHQGSAALLISVLRK